MILVLQANITVSISMTWYHLEYDGDGYTMTGVLNPDLQKDYIVCSQDENVLRNSIPDIITNYINSLDISDVYDYVANFSEDEDEDEPMSPRSIMYDDIMYDMRVVEGFMFSKQFQNLDTYDGF